MDDSERMPEPHSHLDDAKRDLGDAQFEKAKANALVSIAESLERLASLLTQAAPEDTEFLRTPNLGLQFFQHSTKGLHR